jgi:hypothetical protein
MSANLQSNLDFLLAEGSDSINEMYANRDNLENNHLRKVLNGDADRVVRRLRLQLETIETKVACDMFIEDVTDLIEELSHHDGNRSSDRISTYAHGAGAVGAVAGSHSNHSGSGALIGVGVGLLMAHLIKDDAGEVVADALKEIRKVRAEAQAKMHTLKK